MNQGEMLAAIAVVDGRVVLTDDSFPETSLDTLLTDYVSGRRLTIEEATVEAQADGATVKGRTTGLGLVDAPVEATFTLAPDGGLTIDIALQGPDAGARVAWTFTSILPGLQSPIAGLADAVVRDAVLTLTTRPFADDPAGGLTVSGRIAGFAPPGLPGGLSVPLQAGFTARIVTERVAELTPRADRDDWPWSLRRRLPGLHFQAPLGDGASLGSVALRDPAVRAYLPPSAVWADRNSTWPPVAALTGSVEIGGPDRTVAVAAELRQGLLALVGRTDDITLGDLAELAALTGASDLSSALPESLRPAAASVSTLHLQRVEILIDAEGGAPVPRLVSVTVGYPDLNWHPFDGVTFERISATFDIIPGGSPGATLRAVSKMGDTELDVITTAPEFSAQVILPTGGTAPLSALSARWLPGLPSLPDFACDELRLAIFPDRTLYAFATLAKAPGWTLDAGPVTLTFIDVDLEIQKTPGREASASFAGSMLLGDTVELYLAWDYPGELQLRGRLPDVRLSDLWSLLTATGLPAPTDLDATLKDGTILIDRSGEAVEVMVVAHADGLGELGLSVTRGDQGWGAAAGIAIADAGAASGVIGDFARAVDLQKLTVVMSSIDKPGFAFPDVARFSTPDFVARGVRLPMNVRGLQKGLNVYALLGTSNDRGLGALLSMFGVPADGTVGITLALSLPDPKQSSRLFIALQQTVAGVTFDGEFGLLSTGGQIAGFLSARATASIQGADVVFDATAVVYETGVLISASMAGTVDCGPFTLSDLALAIGVDYAGLPSVGFAARIDVDRFESSVAVFLNSVNPAQSLLAGAISDVTLLDVAETIAGQDSIPDGVSDLFGSIGLKGVAAFETTAPGLTAALDRHDHAAVAAAFNAHGCGLAADASGFHIFVAESGRRWFIAHRGRDDAGRPLPHYQVVATAMDAVSVTLSAQLYLALQDTRIGALAFPAGAYVSAEIDEVLIRTTLQIVISTGSGVSASAELAPIELLGGDLLKITSADGQSGPLLSISTMSRPDETDPDLKDPHILVTGRVRLLGLAGEECRLALSTAGLSFRFAQSSPLMSLALDGVIDRHDLGAMHAGGEVSVGFDRTLSLGGFGDVHVQTTVGGKLAISLQQSRPTITFAGGFHFMGLDLEIPKVSFPCAPDLLVDFAGVLADAVSDALDGRLKILLGMAGGAAKIAGLFVQFLGTAAGDMAPLLARAGATAGDIADVLKGVYNLNPEQIARGLLDIGMSALDISVALRVSLDLSEDIVLLALGGAGVALDTISTAFRDGLHMAGEELASLLNSIGLPGDAIASVLTTIFEWPEEQVVSFLKDGLNYGEIGARAAYDGIDTAASTMESAFSDSIDWMRDNFNPTNW